MEGERAPGATALAEAKLGCALELIGDAGATGTRACTGAADAGVGAGATGAEGATGARVPGASGVGVAGVSV